jgi:hypothetical protein
MLNSIFNKIINTSIGKKNLWLAIGGIFLSVLLILASVQLRYNFKQLLKKDSRYLVITKKITNEMMGDVRKSTFSNAEVEDLKRQPYFDSMQPVKTSLFKVKLDIPLNSLPLNTDLFFEAVPNAYLDVVPPGWDWQPGQNRVVGIAPRFLLDMYNYGFAIGQQLPQLSEETIQTIPMNFHLSNADNTSTIDFKGNIGGLSSRFSSILVNEKFLDWANKFYGFKDVPPPARMVAVAKDASSRAMRNYFKSNGMEADFGTGRYAKWAGTIKFIQTLLTVIGVVLFTFALLVLLMFIQLTVTNAKNEIELMSMLGVSPGQLRSFLVRKMTPYFGAAIGTAVFIIVAVQFLFLYNNKRLIDDDIVLPPFPSLTIFGIIWWLNRRTADRFIKRNG